MSTEAILICERVEIKGCGKCHHCGTELLPNNLLTGKNVDYCPKCKASRPYAAHGYAGMFIETSTCSIPESPS